MNLSYIRTLWEEMRHVTGITLRAIDAIPADKIDAHPIPSMRSPKELVCHMADTMRACAIGTTTGKVVCDENAEKGLGITSRPDLVRTMEDAWKTADAAVRSLTETQTTATVETPWGFSPPAWVLIQIIFDEHMHHRGQLYAFLRVLGVEPPFMWDFENSAPEFQPKQALPA
jgi:uncharacterized damage-inducible protein DinB